MSLTKVEIQLIHRLKEIGMSEDQVVGTVLTLGSEENYQTVLDAVSTEKKPNALQVMSLMLELTEEDDDAEEQDDEFNKGSENLDSGVERL